MSPHNFILMPQEPHAKNAEKRKEKKRRRNKGVLRPSEHFICIARLKSFGCVRGQRKRRRRRGACRRGGIRETDNSMWSVSRKCAFHMRRMWRNFALMVIVTFSARHVNLSLASPKLCSLSSLLSLSLFLSPTHLAAPICMQLILFTGCEGFKQIN